MLTIGQHVSTEFGYGIVEDSSPRRVVVVLEEGGSINVMTGTPGYDRIKALD